MQAIETGYRLADCSLFHVKHDSRFFNMCFLNVPRETFSSIEYHESGRRVFILACAGLCVIDMVRIPYRIVYTLFLRARACVWYHVYVNG